jgi:2,4-dienoyl-CoA reductase-like NADH-dependent reductase (Old Yellow Enzyme family)
MAEYYPQRASAGLIISESDFQRAAVRPDAQRLDREDAATNS